MMIRFSLRGFALLFFLLVLSSISAQEVGTPSPVSAIGGTPIEPPHEALSNAFTLPLSETNISTPESTPALEGGAGSASGDPVTTPSVEAPDSVSAATIETPSPNDPNVDVPSSGEEIAMPTPSVMSTESIEKKKQQLKVRYYEVRTQVEKDPAIKELKREADGAPSDEAKRQALRVYYEVLFAKMKNIDHELTSRCETMQAAYLRHLEQISIEPTIPLAPAPAEDGSIEGNPSPSPIAPLVRKKKKLNGS